MKRVIIIALIVVAVVGAAWWLRGRRRQKPGAEEIETVEVERGTVALTVSSDGVLQPLTTVAVKSYAGGTVEVLSVDVGDEVQEGDLIASIDPTDSRTAYDQALADLLSRVAAHAIAIAHPEASVGAGDDLASTEQTPRELTP